MLLVRKGTAAIEGGEPGNGRKEGREAVCRSSQDRLQRLEEVEEEEEEEEGVAWRQRLLFLLPSLPPFLGLPRLQTHHHHVRAITAAAVVAVIAVASGPSRHQYRLGGREGGRARVL